MSVGTAAQSSSSSDPPTKLRLRSLLTEMLAALRSGWKILIAVGLLVYVPVSLLQALDALEGIAVDEWGGTELALLGVLITAQIVIPMIGSVFYSGVAAGVLTRRRGGRLEPLGEVARNLPYGKLIVADLILVALIILGLILLIVPGLILIVWFALIAPVLEFEGGSIRRAFSRSRALVRPHFRTVAVLILATILAQAVVESIAGGVIPAALDDRYVFKVLTALLGNLLTAPLFALAAITVYLQATEAAGEDRVARI